MHLINNVRLLYFQHTHEYMGVAASNHDRAQTLRLLLGQIKHKIVLFIIFGLPTALLSHVCFTIAVLLYTY